MTSYKRFFPILTEFILKHTHFLWWLVTWLPWFQYGECFPTAFLKTHSLLTNLQNINQDIYKKYLYIYTYSSSVVLMWKTGIILTLPKSLTVTSWYMKSNTPTISNKDNNIGTTYIETSQSHMQHWYQSKHYRFCHITQKMKWEEQRKTNSW